jgi:hypothetical protein
MATNDREDQSLSTGGGGVHAQDLAGAPSGGAWVRPCGLRASRAMPGWKSTKIREMMDRWASFISFYTNSGVMEGRTCPLRLINRVNHMIRGKIAEVACC